MRPWRGPAAPAFRPRWRSALTERYAPRPVVRLGLEERTGWRLEVYGIANVLAPERRELDA